MPKVPWPQKEAKALKAYFKDKPEPDSPVTFETGFGPSGLPHIGTFAEVARTTWVRKAFERITGWPTRLIAFSDDMDGLRKVPLNIPKREMLQEHLGKPLCKIPDPFGEEESYSAYMNKKLREFLNAYNFDYQFQSSQEAYTRGDFDRGLLVLLEKYEEIRDVILPTLGAEAGRDWSPFFPICARCGRIYSTRVTGSNPEKGTVDYICDRPVGAAAGCGFRGSTSVVGGRVKVGWKVDWALRWYSYGVGYEMHGKDLIESARLSSRIVRILGGRPPIGLVYEMFLDEEGRKISKSVGRGITVDSWVSYAPLESLLYYLYQNPKRAKRLYWDVIPKSVDDYLALLAGNDQKTEGGIHSIFAGRVPSYNCSVNYSLISNLISGIGSDDPELIRGCLMRYDSQVEKYTEIVDALIEKGIRYYRDFILPHKHYRKAAESEIPMFLELKERLARCMGTSEDDFQAIPFAVAKSFNVQPSSLFKSFYEVILGQTRGPRFGTLVLLLGKDKILKMLAAVA